MVEHDEDPGHQRRFERVDVPLLVQYRFGALDDWHIDYALNVSQGGMFLAAATSKPVGTRVYVQLTTRDGAHLLQGEGRVVRQVTGGHAIELTGFDDEAKHVLAALVEDVRAKATAQRVGLRTRRERG
jgi:hypothetical protein